MGNAQSRINVAVVGLGFMGVTHLRAYLESPKARIVAVCDAHRLPENGVLRGVAGNIKKADDINLGSEVKTCRSLEEVLTDPEVQLVDICTPTSLHPEQVVAALRAGKHVLCEKPLARTSVDARKIVAEADRATGMLMPAMCMRFWTGWAWLKRIVSEQTYGRVLAASFRRMSEMPAWSRSGTYAPGGDAGGALFDLHIHDADFVNFLFGRPASVYASGVMGPDGAINHVSAHYHYPDGPAVYAEGSWLLTQGFNMGYTILCERATIEFDLGRGAEALRVTKPGHASHTLMCDVSDGYSEEIRYVVDCIASATAPQVVTARDGVTALEICEAAESSIRSGRVVEL